MSVFSKLNRPQLRGRNGVVLLVTIVSMILSPVAFANNIGTSFQNFNPTTGSHDNVTVHSSRTIGAGKFSLGLFLNQAYNTLPYSKEKQEEVDQSRSNLNDSVLGSDVAIGFGLLPFWDIGIVIPTILNQSADSEEDHGQFAENGVTEYRLMTKFRLLNAGRSGIATVASANINQTNNNPYAGADGGPGYNLELVADYFVGRLGIAGNIGYKWANAGQGEEIVPIQPAGDQALLSAALSYQMTQKLQTVLEVFGASAAAKKFDFSDRDGASAESLIGLKFFQTPAIAYQFGGGTELIHGTATPDWRIYAGINWNTPIKKKPGSKKIATPVKKVAPKPTPVSKKPERVVLVSDVLFDFNSARLVKKGSMKNIDKLAGNLKRPPMLEKLIIEGHTCNVGAAAYNRSLSKRRAETIKQLLITRYKIPAAKISTIGFGEDRPLANNKTSAGRKQNRRVEFKIYRQGTSSPARKIAKK